jgi:hypothetical protein
LHIRAPHGPEHVAHRDSFTITRESSCRTLSHCSMLCHLFIWVCSYTGFHEASCGEFPHGSTRIFSMNSSGPDLQKCIASKVVGCIGCQSWSGWANRGGLMQGNGNTHIEQPEPVQGRKDKSTDMSRLSRSAPIMRTAWVRYSMGSKGTAHGPPPLPWSCKTWRRVPSRHGLLA